MDPTPSYVLFLSNRRRSPACNRFASSDRVQTFIRLGLHIHLIQRNAEQVGQLLADQWFMFFQLWFFRMNYNIQLLDLKAGFRHSR